jgi:hypothetical protein
MIAEEDLEDFARLAERLSAHGQHGASALAWAMVTVLAMGREAEAVEALEGLVRECGEDSGMMMLAGPGAGLRQ